jgi:hypothetical protein
MSAGNFDSILRLLAEKRPFTVFTVELNGGRRIEVDSPNAIVFRDGVAVFVARQWYPDLVRPQ